MTPILSDLDHGSAWPARTRGSRTPLSPIWGRNERGGSVQGLCSSCSPARAQGLPLASAGILCIPHGSGSWRQPPSSTFLAGLPQTKSKVSLLTQGSDVPPASPPALLQSRKAGWGVCLRPVRTCVCVHVWVCTRVVAKPGCILPTQSTPVITNSGDETSLGSICHLGRGGLTPHHPESSLDWWGAPLSILQTDGERLGEAKSQPSGSWWSQSRLRLQAGCTAQLVPFSTRASVLSGQVTEAGRTGPGATQQLCLPWAPSRATFQQRQSKGKG